MTGTLLRAFGLRILAATGGKLPPLPRFRQVLRARPDEAIAARQAMAKRRPSLLKEQLQRYGLAVVSVGIAMGIGLLLQRYSFRDVESLLLLFAIA